jgi:hypothetical protein
LAAARDEQHQFEKKTKEDLEKQKVKQHVEQEAALKSKCPKDIDYFKEYLGYNLEDIGVPTNADYYALLKDHMGEILFQRKPVIIGRNTAFSLMNCISNTLVKTSTIPALAFAPDIVEEAIDAFLSQNKRIVCLDNFIGNCNETTLITICDRHRDKIIFLTVIYDRTLCYVPDELMKYCHYLNLNRIEALAGDKELTEDPSIIDETETPLAAIIPDARWSAILKEMLDDFGICGALSAYKSSLINDELRLCRLLAFDVLPYCVDVLKIAPFNASERFLKYAGATGRCPYKDLFRRWFA